VCEAAKPEAVDQRETIVGAVNLLPCLALQIRQLLD
jgi:hypothetical protein